MLCTVYSYPFLMKKVLDLEKETWNSSIPTLPLTNYESQKVSKSFSAFPCEMGASNICFADIIEMFL